jgi:CDP-diacylglycerol--glycerol-3-phosphate 3-phosphatidyltransferase
MKTLNLPNQLTLGRLGLCVLFVVVLSIDDFAYAGTAALAIFVVASLTDWLDGWLARKYNLITDLGKLLDPLADKVLISAAFVGLMDATSDDFQGPPMWMVVAIISREFLITGLRLVAGSRGFVMAADWAGKHKTITQMVYILISLVLMSGLELDLGDLSIFNYLKIAQGIALWLALIVTIASGCYYFFKNRNLFATEEGVPSSLPPPLPGVVSTGLVANDPPPVIAPSVGFPAFKEWQVIVAALGRGDQSIILRKGGIAEGKSGFQVKHQRFWLFPTQFHQQVEKTKPAAAVFYVNGLQEDGPVRLEFFAEVTQVDYLHDWESVAKLDALHFWKEEVLKERFAWGEEPGLHCILVRIHRVLEPLTLEWKPGYGGCKSWVEVPRDFSGLNSVPVLGDEAFAALQGRINQKT